MNKNLDYKAGEIMLIREATWDDRRALWEWYHDSLRYKTFRSRQPDKEYEQHTIWFNQLMKNPDIVLCIGIDDNLRVGCVRFDHEQEDVYNLNFFLKPLYCGREYSIHLLREAINYLNRIQTPKKIVVDVQLDSPNVAIQRMFEILGFSFVNYRGELNLEV